MILMELITLTAIPSLIHNIQSPSTPSQDSFPRNSISIKFLPDEINTQKPKLIFTDTSENSGDDNTLVVKQPILSQSDIQKTLTFNDENETLRTQLVSLKLPRVQQEAQSPIQLFNIFQIQWPTNPPVILTTTKSVHEKLIDLEEKNENLNCTSFQTEYNSTCYTVLRQLPCPPGEWLVEDEITMKGKCVENKCAGKPDAAFHDGKCIKVRSEETCPYGMKTYIFKSGKVDCDCKEGFLYSKQENKCYKAYRQGPCRKSFYFAVRNDSIDTEFVLPACIKNPCIFDGYFCNAGKCPAKKVNMWRVPNVESLSQMNCVKFGTTCTQKGRGMFIIHPDTNSPFCQEDIRDINGPDRVIGNVPTLKCAPGSRRDILGNCRTPTTIEFS